MTLLQKDEWLAYAALLPVLLTLAGIGVTVAIAYHNPALWHVATVSVIGGSADDYVQGLARLGIVKLPGYDLPSVDDPEELSTPLVAAH
jgi:hypothetical protein